MVSETPGTPRAAKSLQIMMFSQSLARLAPSFVPISGTPRRSPRFPCKFSHNFRSVSGPFRGPLRRSTPEMARVDDRPVFQVPFVDLFVEAAWTSAQGHAREQAEVTVG